MPSTYDVISNIGLALTLLGSLAVAPFVTDALVMTYERFFGPIHDFDDDLNA